MGGRWKGHRFRLGHLLSAIFRPLGRRYKVCVQRTPLWVELNSYHIWGPPLPPGTQCTTVYPVVSAFPTASVAYDSRAVSVKLGYPAGQPHRQASMLSLEQHNRGEHCVHPCCVTYPLGGKQRAAWFPPHFVMRLILYPASRARPFPGFWRAGGRLPRQGSKPGLGRLSCP